MPSSTYSPYGNVHLGFWINQELGNVQGATLTLDRRSGNLLISFLALFIGMTGRGFWKIIRMYLHFKFSTQTAPDAVYHQRQVILRNSTAQDATIALVEACHAWRKRGMATLRRVLPVALVAALLSAAFTITGGFSSKFILSKAGSEVLLSGDPSTCGPLPDATTNSNNPSDLRYLDNEYLSYALRCYPPITPENTDGCTDFVQQYLNYKKDTNASCPFAADVCKSPTGNLIVETDLLDSSKHVGVNKGPRVNFRHKLQCAPLVTAGFTNTSFDKDTSSTWLSYKYGQRDGKFPYFNPVQINATVPLSSAGDYRVTTISASNANKGNITLIPQLNLSDARTTIFWLDSTSIFNKLKVYDPWFYATTPSYPPDLGYTTASGAEWYTSDEPRGVIGCASYFTFCNPKLPQSTGCVDLNTPAAQSDMKRIWTNKGDLAFLRFLLVALMPVQAGTLESFYQIPSLPYIQRRDTVQGNRQIADDLHPETWKFEFEYIFQGMLAAVQRNAIELAGEYWPDGVSCPPDAPCARACKFQKIRSTLHYSFSVLILCLVFIIGGIILIISYLLEIMLDAAFKIPAIRNNPKLQFAYAEWQTSTPLQLQRLAHEAIGLGTWSGATAAIPVTIKGDVLGVLDVRDKDHPRLIAPRVGTENIQVRPKGVERA